MAFGLSSYNANCRVSSYQDAVDLHARIKPWRGDKDPHSFRPLPWGSKRSHDKVVRTDAEGHVIFRYHYSDVVTWVSPDKCVLDISWQSQSTRAFADAFAPTGVFTSGQDPVLVGTHKGSYSERKLFKPRKDSAVTLRRDPDTHAWYVADSVPFEIPRIDRKKAREVRAIYHYDDFMALLRSILTLTGASPSTRSWSDQRVHDKWSVGRMFAARHVSENVGRMLTARHVSENVDALELLQTGSREEWAQFITQSDIRYAHPDTVADYLRELIYKRHPEAITHETVPYLDGWSGEKTFRSAIRKY